MHIKSITSLEFVNRILGWICLIPIYNPVAVRFCTIHTHA